MAEFKILAIHFPNIPIPPSSFTTQFTIDLPTAHIAFDFVIEDLL